jgi:2-keto-4-pentenoate hydratase/2-oxohepta-3-ene-1,7-dioic acid hydratase in catechol pathway
MRNGLPSLGLVVGERILIAAEAAALSSRYSKLRRADDVTALWDPELSGLVTEMAGETQDGIPSAWQSCCLQRSDAEWLPPVCSPEKIICIGLNYKEHAAESQMRLPREPVFFNKYNNSLTGASGPVILPCNSSQVDFEAELAVVIGATAKRVSERDAWNCVGGYTIMHDVSARDWQFRTGQWVAGKSFDSFAPCGPWVVTPDEITDPHQLDIRLRLNGTVMQDSNTRHLIFQVPVLISYLSHIFTLKPGDIVSTGTPSGIGFARQPQVFLKPGDLIEIEIAQVGIMRHTCVAEAADGNDGVA